MLWHYKREDGFDLPVEKGQCDLTVSVDPFQTNIYFTCFGHSNKFTAYLIIDKHQHMHFFTFKTVQV